MQDKFFPDFHKKIDYTITKKKPEVDEDLVDSITSLMDKFMGGVDVTCFSNLNESTIEALKEHTQEALDKELDASPNSMAGVGLKECKDKLDDPTTSPKQKSIGFLTSLAKWGKEISISEEGKKFLEWVANFFKGIVNKVETACSQLFWNKKGNQDTTETPVQEEVFNIKV